MYRRHKLLDRSSVEFFSHNPLDYEYEICLNNI
jgi:hypothetical protein